MANPVGTTAGGGLSAEMTASLEAQRQIQAQSQRDQTAQIMFQDQKNRQNEALKAISDAVKDGYQNRMDQIRNIKQS